jgi:hypothetical protein
MKKFNITLSELEAAVQYAKEHGVSEHKTITMCIEPSGGIGAVVTVSSEWDGKRFDITDYSAW